MGSKVWLMFMPLALAMMTGCSTATIFNKGHRYFRTSNRGLLVEKIDEIEPEMMMDSETDDQLVSLGINTLAMHHFKLLQSHAINVVYPITIVHKGLSTKRDETKP
ncbi:hypothetical protein ES332_A06G239600v1 [Gossypium tomentosum]|uniref:Uncharacterized protein n=1 Tax=Gossypium tomentosum TaxID=34277 RepID=A0A5D2Q8U5_GOSTO|nr:hypothetical protein ES332_A06G239600v1 [Gossypium tomentosum]